jgi:hypothetical protein
MAEVSGITRQSNVYTPERSIRIPAWLQSDKEAA